MPIEYRTGKTTPLFWNAVNNQTNNKPVVLVTGTSSGIGLALARLLYESQEYRVVVTARHESLNKLYAEFQESERFWIRKLDVVSQDNILELIQEIDLIWGGVDILINNAGISYRAVVEDMAYSDEELQIKTNYNGPFSLIRSVIPGMRKKRSGRIINVSSVGGMMAMPTMASYSASKFALEGGTEALWYEMKPWNIKVSLIQPGFVNSESFKKVRYTAKFFDSFQEESYRAYYLNMSRLIENLMAYSPTTHEDIACLILKVMKQKRPKLRIPATWDAHFFALLRRLLPRNIYHHVLYFFLPRINTWVKPTPCEETLQEFEETLVQQHPLFATSPEEYYLEWRT